MKISSTLKEKLWRTLIQQSPLTVLAMALDYLFNVVLVPTSSYTPWITLIIVTVIGVPFNFYNISLRIDAQRSRRALAVSQAARNEALARLELALEDAEAASRAKSAFLATMSHEIRTPLNGVLGMADAMSAGPLEDAQRERLEVIRQCGQGLLAQLNDVLDLSKIEAGKLELEEISFDLGLVVDSAAGAFSALAAAKGLDFVVDIDAVRGAYRGDPTRLRQVLSNLISNALKFTERGAIRVAATRVGRRVLFTVADSGVGMSQQVIDTLFSKFAQADASTSRRFGGTGLGLSICRELVAMMGGEISVTSTVGEGACFSFEVPLAPAERLTADPGPAPAGDGLGALRVLAVDDNPINRLVIKTLLNQIGVEPVLAEDGAGALSAWKPGLFDVVLMDVHMPVMDGLEATRAIRRQEAALRAARTPIIALTADVMSHQLAEFGAAGMDAHVAKPVEAARLFEAIEAALSPEALPAAAVA